VARRAIAGRIVGRPELCQTFGITKYEAEKWVQAGCPVVERPSGPGGEWRFDTADVADWLAQRALAAAGLKKPLDLESERARLAREQADAQELKNAQARGELLPANEVEGLWQSAAGRCRSILLGIPNSSAERIVLIARREETAEAAARAVRDLLTGQIDGALVEMARLEVEDDDEDGFDAPGEQAALRNSLAVYEPPARTPPSKWMEEEYVVSAEESAEPGRYSFDRYAYLRGVICAG
jgi:phage terminase Nu1 subunit (DNA packaging protein)